MADEHVAAVEVVHPLSASSRPTPKSRRTVLGIPRTDSSSSPSGTSLALLAFFSARFLTDKGWPSNGSQGDQSHTLTSRQRLSTPLRLLEHPVLRAYPRDTAVESIPRCPPPRPCLAFPRRACLERRSSLAAARLPPPLRLRFHPSSALVRRCPAFRFPSARRGKTPRPCPRLQELKDLGRQSRLLRRRPLPVGRPALKSLTTPMLHRRPSRPTRIDPLSS